MNEFSDYKPDITTFWIVNLKQHIDIYRAAGCKSKTGCISFDLLMLSGIIQ